MRIDAAPRRSRRLELDPVERGLVLTSLVEAADRVDSTCGVQMAYLKRWAPRAANALDLREPRARRRARAATVTCATRTRSPPALAGVDLAYVDPPYNQHSYLGNYHVWETLVVATSPIHYGVACKRADCRTRKSAYNSRRGAWPSAEPTCRRACRRPGRSRRSRTRASTIRPPSQRCSASGDTSGAFHHRVQALRGRPDRDPQPRRGGGGIRVAPAEHRVDLRLRPRPQRRRGGAATGAGSGRPGGSRRAAPARRGLTDGPSQALRRRRR